MEIAGWPLGAISQVPEENAHHCLILTLWMNERVFTMAEFLGFLMQDLRDDDIFVEKAIVQPPLCPFESSFYSLF